LQKTTMSPRRRRKSSDGEQANIKAEDFPLEEELRCFYTVGFKKTILGGTGGAGKARYQKEGKKKRRFLGMTREGSAAKILAVLGGTTKNPDIMKGEGEEAPFTSS